MNKQGYKNNISVKNQKGAAILLTVVLLLVMVTLVTLYTGKIQSFEHQILLNTQNQKWAQASANAGLNQGLAVLNSHKLWPDSEITGSLGDNSTFVITGVSEDLLDKRQLVTIQAIGTSADGLAKATVAQQYLVYPILFNLPSAPLIVKQGFSTDGQFEIAANPDGLGAAAPLSLWTDEMITLTGTLHHSCAVNAFNAGNCSSNTYSDHNLKHTDISDGSMTFPIDLFSYLFNVPAGEWKQLQEQADFVFTDCDSLDVGSWGLIWINGDCEVAASTFVAHETAPVILIVFDGNVEFQSDVVFYGLLFAFKPHNSIKVLDINMHTDSAVLGAVVSNYQLGTKNGLTRVVFDEDVMANLQSHKSLKRIASVPGSWHDF
ncbi:hypothetical protein [uncultured Paraglaciecola sp.]|uniref:hypothetical protein n=1 Tax=uncultured Paraglaciecola sp. TaxID=1765024 RepID=UPI00261A4623|nr:hypothetical protein [uncultured Paraglaciecola sp.]